MATGTAARPAARVTPASRVFLTARFTAWLTTLAPNCRLAEPGGCPTRLGPVVPREAVF